MYSSVTDRDSFNTWKDVRACALPATLILLFVLGVQVSQRTYRADLATYPDEAAHFVTAICLLDYVRTSFGDNPMAFAESYYVHYPKLAAGHWPPAFYVVQAVWYHVLGATPPTALLLAASIAALACLVFFVTARRIQGTWIAFLSTVVLLCLPMVHRSVSKLMSDMLVSMFAFLAVLAFSDSLRSNDGRRTVAGLLWTAAAILTKESALTLLVFIPAAVLLFGRSRALRAPTTSRLLWGGLALVTVSLLGTYAISGVLHLRGLPQVSTWPDTMGRLHFLLRFAQDVPVAVLVISAIGAGATIPGSPNRPGPHCYVRGSILWLTIWLVFQVLFRDTIEARYFLPAVFPLMILFAEGLDVFARLTARLTNRAAGLVPLGASLLCIVTMPASTPPHRTGYAAVAEAIPFAGASSVVLVSSDSVGEGALVSERLIRDPERRGFVLRASKMLASANWMGTIYEPLVTSVQDVRERIDAIPVHFIVIDMYGFASDMDRPHHRLLDQAVRQTPAQFRLVGDFPLSFGGRQRAHAIQVYENLAARGRTPEVIRVPMAESLGRTLEARVDPRSAGLPPDEETAARIRELRAGVWIENVAARLENVLPRRAPAGLEMQIVPKRDELAADGGPGQVYVTAGPDRTWGVRASTSWIIVASDSRGRGDGVVSYEVQPNTTDRPRTGKIAIGGMRYSILQRPRSSSSSSAPAN
jgi:hypothetical protein